jgi:hypothetical protein
LMTWKRRSKKSLRKLGNTFASCLLQMRHRNLLCQPNINLSHLGEVPARAEGAELFPILRPCAGHGRNSLGRKIQIQVSGCRP